MLPAWLVRGQRLTLAQQERWSGGRARQVPQGARGRERSFEETASRHATTGRTVTKSVLGQSGKRIGTLRGGAQDEGQGGLANSKCC